MARPCKWCGEFFKNQENLRQHENIHKDLDQWSLLEQDGMDSKMYWEVEDIHEQMDSVDDHTSTEMDLTHDHEEPENRQRANFICDLCHKSFTKKRNYVRHQKCHHGKNQFFCSKCDKRFKRNDNKITHESVCKGSQHVCPRCHKRCSTAQGLLRHLQSHDKVPVTKPKDETSGKRRKPTPTEVKSSEETRPSQFRCRRCTEVFHNRHDLYLHGMRQHHAQVGGALQSRPWGRNEVLPWDGDDSLREVYEANAPIILEHHHQGPLQSVYNFPVTNDVNINQLMGFAEDIFQRQQRAFRLNLVFEVILQNRDTGEYRYLVPYTNSEVFERPVYLSRKAELQRLRRQLESKDILTELLRQRPDTKWVPVLVTNVHFMVTETFYPVGLGHLPDYLMKKDSLYPLVKSRQTRKVYEDHLCAFRCLALHRGHDIMSLENPTKQLFEQWSDETPHPFEGISIHEFPDFETRFDVNLEVYSLQEDGFARSVYSSRGQHTSTMYLNLYENHLSYIKDFAAHAQKYQCKTCERHFDRAGNLHRHQRSCSNRTKFVYPGGFHRAKDSIFEELDQYEINVPEDERTFPWYIGYDFEAILQKVRDQPTEFLQWTQKHVPISVSICSNVDGYSDPVCIVNADADRLVEEMVSTMNEVADRVYELAKDKWDWVLEAIEDKIRESEELELDFQVDMEDHSEYEDDEATEDQKETRKPSHPLKKFYGRLEGYMSQVPVLGFNSSKYDLNLIKRCLAKHLNMHEDRDAFVVKNNNAYTCIATESLKFLDMSQFLAPGSSYAGFLKAYHVEEQKGYFPYEWFDDVTKLEATSLPPHGSFYSHLKNGNISETEYEFCQQVWKDHRMTTFRDFLIWYNNLDVVPFVEAVKHFLQYYFEKGIDVFKTAISVPGIARQLLFKTARKHQANFALFDEHNKDLYQTVKRNIVGGPSIIFTRHHCAGQTRIRGQKPCQAILGFDANALYLQAIGQPMPVGPFIRRKANNDFRPELRDKYMSAYYWMDWLAHSQGVTIQHKLNSGREVRIGKYPVDGFVPATTPADRGTVFQFHGCYWHGHRCWVTRGVKNEEWHATRAEKYRKTQETTAFLKRDHRVIEMWECQFRQYCRQHPQIYTFIDHRRPGFF